MERGVQPGAPGPLCVLNNQFKHLEKVAWRMRVRDSSGGVLDDKGLKSVVVVLPDGKKVEAKFGGHPPRAPTDQILGGPPGSFRATIRPARSPTSGVTATDMAGNTATWEPFKIASSQLTIQDGAIEIKKPN